MESCADLRGNTRKAKHAQVPSEKRIYLLRRDSFKDEVPPQRCHEQREHLFLHSGRKLSSGEKQNEMVFRGKRSGHGLFRATKHVHI
jgi:hypothetical protein